MPILKNTIYANLKFVDDGKTEKERIDRLKHISCIQIKEILSFAFNPKIEWDLEKEIRYNPSKDELNSLIMSLFREINRLCIFVKNGPYPNLTTRRRTIIFISVLENLHPDDAKLLLGIKDGKLPFKNITKDLIIKTFGKKGFTKDW